MYNYLIVLVLILLKKDRCTEMVNTTFFGNAKTGEKVNIHEITNGNIKAVICDYGARVLNLEYKGVKCVCGFDTMEALLTDGDYHGSIAGRYANRIAEGKFTLNGVTYQLNNNERGETHLHGGNVGFSNKVWTLVDSGDNFVTLKLVSEDGDEGYPGTLTLLLTYKVENDTLYLDYDGTTDKDTIVNLTNHMYFAIGGVGEELCTEQTLMLNASHIAEVDAKLIPTGKLIDVTGTPFDFNTAKKIGKDIAADDTQIAFGGGYDHGFVLSSGNPAAVLHSDKTGFTVTVNTTEGGIQIYTGNYLREDLTPFFGNITQKKNAAVCLECNKLPDSPNRPEFPSCVLKVGEHYIQKTSYKFEG